MQLLFISSELNLHLCSRSRHRGFLFLQQPQVHPETLLIPGTITAHPTGLPAFILTFISN
jgi:hypothetical protein